MTVNRFSGYEITCDICDAMSIIHTMDERTFAEALADNHTGPWSRIDGKDVCRRCIDLVTTPT